MSAPTPRVNSHLLSLHTGTHPTFSYSAVFTPIFASHRLRMTAGAGQQVALVGRVKDCSPDMARVEAADGADVTIKRNG